MPRLGCLSPLDLHALPVHRRPLPHFSGSGGIAPPGGNIGLPGAFVPGWSPDLRKYENRCTMAILVKL